MRHFRPNGWKKFLSGLMAAVMILGLLPVTALAADDMPSSITMSDCQFMGKYQSANGLGNPLLHFFKFYVNGGDVVGLCLDHSKSMGTHSVGKTWALEKTIPAKSDLLTIFADYYYYSTVAASEELDRQYPELTAAEKEEMLKDAGKPTSNMWLRKYDQLTGIGLEGAVFKITKADGSLVRENVRSGPDGFIKVNDLDEGAYIITETKAPTGYVLNSTPRNIFLRHNVTEIIDIPNVKPGSIAIRKVDAKTKEPLAGAKFAIYTSTSPTTCSTGTLPWR